MGNVENYYHQQFRQFFNKSHKATGEWDGWAGWMDECRACQDPPWQ